jgi:hypothetical protein
VREEESVVHLLLFSTRLDQLVSRKLAVAKVFQNFALLLGSAKHLELTPPQVLQLGSVVG